MADNEGRHNRHKKCHRRNPHLPQRPKKPLSAYTAFVKEYFKTHRPKNSDEARAGIKAASAIWNKKSDREKRIFATGSAKEREKYNRDMAKWRAQKDLLKRPASSYALFLKATWEAERESGRGFADMSEHVSERWRGMTEAAKEVYRGQYEELADNYYDIMERLNDGELDINTVTVRNKGRFAQAHRRSSQRQENNESDEEEEEADAEEEDEVEDDDEDMEE